MLGLADPEERAEFERMCAHYTEVKEAREAFELSLEQQLLNDATTPPAIIKRSVMAAVVQAEGKDSKKTAARREALVVRMRWLRVAVAASIILLAGSAVLNWYLYTQYKDYSDRYDQLAASQRQLATTNQSIQTKLDNYDSALNLIKDPVMAVIKLPGLSKGPSPGSEATVYWNTRSKDVYLLVNSLPEPLANKQYQLWAIVNGKPVDAGVFDIQNGLSFVKLKNIPKAQAFAITLENRGGSQKPSMNALYVMGKVTG